MLTGQPPKEDSTADTVELGLFRSMPTSIRMAAYKSKIEELEIKLALLRRSKEHTEPASIIKKLVGLVTTFVHLKYYLILKKQNLRDQSEGHEENVRQLKERLLQARQAETLLIVKFEARLRKIDLKLFILRLRSIRFGQRYEVKVAPDRSLIEMYLTDKDVYYPTGPGPNNSH